MHDWLSYRHKYQFHKNMPLSVSPQVMKKMNMEIEGFCFYVPVESAELFEAGHKLHNCVTSYAKWVREKKCVIALLKEEGKLIACIEIRGGRIVQAKIDCNRPAINNRRVGEVIFRWSKKARLKIDTADLALT